MRNKCETFTSSVWWSSSTSRRTEPNRNHPRQCVAIKMVVVTIITRKQVFLTKCYKLRPLQGSGFIIWSPLSHWMADLSAIRGPKRVDDLLPASASASPGVSQLLSDDLTSCPRLFRCRSLMIMEMPRNRGVASIYKSADLCKGRTRFSSWFSGWKGIYCTPQKRVKRGNCGLIAVGDDEGGKDGNRSELLPLFIITDNLWAIGGQWSFCNKIDRLDRITDSQKWLNFARKLSPSQPVRERCARFVSSELLLRLLLQSRRLLCARDHLALAVIYNNKCGELFLNHLAMAEDVIGEHNNIELVERKIVGEKVANRYFRFWSKCSGIFVLFSSSCRRRSSTVSMSVVIRGCIQSQSARWIFSYPLDTLWAHRSMAGLVLLSILIRRRNSTPLCH